MSSATPVVTPTLKDFEAAEANVLAIAKVTPILDSFYLSDLTGGQVFLKAENLQRTGAYKLRGANNRMSKLTALHGHPATRRPWRQPLTWRGND